MQEGVVVLDGDFCKRNIYFTKLRFVNSDLLVKMLQS